MSLEATFLTWNDSRRSMSISARLGLKRVVLVAQRRGLARHALGSLATAAFLIRHRPRVVWFQFSLALGLVLWMYSRVRVRGSVRLIADLHTKAMRRSGARGADWLVRRIKGLVLRSCAAVLVTNPENAAYLDERYAARALVLPDPLPRITATVDRADERAQGTPEVAFVCSYAPDEPLDVLTETAARLCGEARIFFTGDAARIEKPQRTAAQTVARFTGFLSDEDYWSLLQSVACIVIVSDQPACLPCGAYESIAVGKRPVIVDDPSAREVFGDLAVYAALRPEALAAAIRLVLRERRTAADAALATQYEDRWQNYWQRVQLRLDHRDPR